jgi:hypothetical protein
MITVEEQQHLIKLITTIFPVSFYYFQKFISVLSSQEFLGISLRNPNGIREELQSILKSGNVCYHTLQNTLSSSWYPRKKIHMYRTAIFPCYMWAWKLVSQTAGRKWAEGVRE